MVISIPAILLTATIIPLSVLFFQKKLLKFPMCNITKDLTGKVIVITGANSGIGRETALELAKMNATVIIASRDPKKSIPVVDELKERTGNDKIEFIQLDLADLESIKNFAEKFKAKYNRLDTLINNAGLVLPTRTLTKYEFETVFGTNHLGHFYLTKLLLDVIEKSEPSRIINVSSYIHRDIKKIDWNNLMYEKGYEPGKVYPHSKLMNVIFTRELQKRVDSSKVKVVALDPGLVKTDICRGLDTTLIMKIFMGIFFMILNVCGRTPNEGAQTSIYCAVEDHEKLEGGMYYANCKVDKVNKLVDNEENCKRIWEVSEQYIENALNKQ